MGKGILPRRQWYYTQHRHQVIHELLQDLSLMISFHSHVKQFYMGAKNESVQPVTINITRSLEKEKP